MQIVQTIKTQNPEKMAYLFGACLAADKGVSNKVEKSGNGYIVVADDGKAVKFTL